jgi:transposase
VEETLQPGASVAVIARQHGVDANQVFHWRKLYREGRLELKPSSAQLLPVRIAETVSIERAPAKLYEGSIVVELDRARIASKDRSTPRASAWFWSALADDLAAHKREHLDLPPA